MVAPGSKINLLGGSEIRSWILNLESGAATEGRPYMIADHTARAAQVIVAPSSRTVIAKSNGLINGMAR